MLRRFIKIAAFVCIPIVGSLACGSRGIVMAEDMGPSPGFVSADSGTTDGDVDAGDPISYCATNKCPAGSTTCPSSRFPCDVNLKTDPNNCGACGVVCPNRRGHGLFACIDGACKMTCTAVGTGSFVSVWADCNGSLDDDCEIELGTNENCRACGDTCPDPQKPCIRDASGMGKQCGCDPGMLDCDGECVDPRTSDGHCGGCGLWCDPGGDGAPEIANGYYGCGAGACGNAKCETYFADCDGKLTNGCEAVLIDPENCGACGVACEPGQACVINDSGVPECRCPKGKTLCGDKCADLSADSQNCGACGSTCAGLKGPNATGVCSHGSCTVACNEGWGNCNGDSKDGCESNLQSDPRNCGTCGNSCDLAAGQPCVAGRCIVEPCKPEEGTTN